MTTIWIVSMNSWMRIFCRLKSGTVSIGWKHSIRYAFDQPQGDLCNVVLGGARRSYTKMCGKERSLVPCETGITTSERRYISKSETSQNILEYEPNVDNFFYVKS